MFNTPGPGPDFIRACIFLNAFKLALDSAPQPPLPAGPAADPRTPESTVRGGADRRYNERMRALALAVVSVCLANVPILAQTPGQRSPAQPSPGQPAAAPVTFLTLLGELTDLDRLARLPDPDYRTVQFGSSDRRSVSPDQPGWFANADGFGQEPTPGFVKTLREPGADGVGEYLVCDVDGPGAIVRGWSAGMDGVLKVWLDGAEKPLFEGKGYDFFARRAAHLFPHFLNSDIQAAQLPFAQWIDDPVVIAALQPQQDADYTPVPFGKHLRITWTGRVADLHFYQLQVRHYAAGARVETFHWDPHGEAILGGFRRLLGSRGKKTTPQPPAEPVAIDLPIDANWHHEQKATTAAALQDLELSIAAADMPRALRGVLLRIQCDGAAVPQVEAPLGDFFASAPGVTPFDSAPLQVRADGTLVCRWVMPYRRTWRIELQNHSGIAVHGTMRHQHAPLPNGFDDRTCYFHAHWRVDHDLHAHGGKAPIDLPYLFAIGQGRLVGVACQIVNPPMAPSWRSNWWGEGDERFAIDGVVTTFGTGTEDYFNYSWSHWNYFAHPFCGQPLSTGPGNCGFVSNHRFQIVDDLPFAQSLALSMELWTHKEVQPLSYGRIAYFYARPGVLTDHRALQVDELHVPKLPPWPVGALQTTGDAPTWRPGAIEHGYHASAGDVEPQQQNGWTRSGAILSWQAPAGARLALPFTISKAGSYRLRVSCQQRPDAPAVQVLVDGAVRQVGAEALFALGCVHGQRFEDLLLESVELTAGEHELTLLCPTGGIVGIDLFGYEALPPKPAALPGASEAELWDVVEKSPGVDIELQQLGAGWSSGHQRWVMATAVGDAATFRVPATGTAKAKVVLRLTASRDYGIVQVDWNGQTAARDVDLWSGPEARITIREVDLGERDLTKPVLLRFIVTGHAAGNQAPHFYFGVDCLVVGS